MAILALDLGGTKLAAARFTTAEGLTHRSVRRLPVAKGAAVGEMMVQTVRQMIDEQDFNDPITGIGVCIPGIYRKHRKTVWAPNIAGWEDFPLLELLEQAGGLPVTIDSDRACCVLGEYAYGVAQGCDDVVFLAVGTGIGAGILAGGEVLRGAFDAAGAVGWMALERQYRTEFDQCGCFEHYASGDGIARTTRALLGKNSAYTGSLGAIPLAKLTAVDVFRAYERGEPFARRVLANAVEYWGMASANLVSIFNPEKVVFGGGVFGPATTFIDEIRDEAAKWAQPISMQQVEFVPSALGSDAALFGAAWMVMHQ